MRSDPNPLVAFAASVRAALAELDGAERLLGGGENPRESSGINRSARRTEITSPREAIPRARAGRMVVLPPWRNVLVRPLERFADDPSAKGPAAYRELHLVALSRVPVAGECLVDGDGRTLRVLGVRHLPAGEVAAEVQVEALDARALTERSDAR